LYAALDRLKADGLVTSDKEEIVDGRLRRYYRITDEGTAELAAEVGRLRANAAIAASRLGLAGGTAWRNARPDDRHRDQVQPDGAAVPAAARPVPQ
jgi:DNA-binding PadR family transcriptional regulator